MTFANKDAHSDPIFKELEIIKVKDLITSNNITFVHKTLNGNSPGHFDNYFEKVKPVHNYNTRRTPVSTHSIPLGSVSINKDSANTLQNNVQKIGIKS